LWDSSLLVVTSDHGEEFGEHDQYGHGRTLYDTLLRVPLLLHYPGWYDGGRRVDTPVQLVDVAPSILEVAGLRAPRAWVGRSLRDTAAARDLLASVTRTRPGQDAADWQRLPTARSLCASDHKWVWYPGREAEQERYEIFDHGDDPGELVNLWTADRTGELQRRIEAVRARYPVLTTGDPNRAEVSADAVEQLRALGYVK